MSPQTKYLLSESDIPKAWYNINADMPVDPGDTAWNAVLHPASQEPLTPDFLSALFPKRFVEATASTERWVEIPEPVLDVYKLWRPTPLIRARRLERALDTPAMSRLPLREGRQCLQPARGGASAGAYYV